MASKDVLTLAARIKEEREAQLASLVSSTMSDAGRAADRVERQARELGNAIGELGGMMTGMRIRRLYNYRALLDAVGSEVDMMSMTAYNALEDSRDMLYSGGAEDMASLIGAQFRGDTEVVEAMIKAGGVAIPYSQDYMIANDRMRRTFDSLAQTTQEYIGEKIEGLASVSQLLDPASRTASIATDGFGTAIAWLTSMSSMAFWSMLLLGMSAGLQANAGLVNGWVWWSRLDAKVCPSCISLHGQMFSVDDVMVDHPHGRCIPIPVVNGDTLLAGYLFEDDETPAPTPDPWEPPLTGEEWFEGLDADMQREILGPAAYRAWRAGSITLSDLSVDADHDIYGKMKATTSLTHILGAEEAKRFSLQGD